MSVIQAAIENKGEIFHRSGDEMLVLLPNFNESEACSVGERVRKAIEEHNFSTIGQGVVSATIGVSTYPSHCPTWEELPVVADQAAMQAKKRRKNTVLHCSSLQGEASVSQSD